MQFVLPSPKIKAAIISVSNKNNGGHTLYRLLPFCNADFFSLAVVLFLATVKEVTEVVSNEKFFTTHNSLILII